jgi:hypothetical protein
VNRRRFVLTSLAGALAAPLGAGAQQPGKVWRVGILDGGAPTQERQANWNAFREALRTAGYVENKNVAFEFRWGSGHVANLGVLAGELVRANVDLIATAGTPAALAAKQTTASVPIVLVIAGDPVRTGLASTLRRPGGNVTGLTTLSTELSGKRLALLRELLPRVTQLGVLWDSNPAFALAVQDTEVAARTMKVNVQTVAAHSRDNLDAFFADLNRLRLDALEVMPGQLFLRERQLIAGLAVGFGAQNLVRDVIAGFFLILENQVRLGDVVTINGKSGLVEAIRLRTTVLRGSDGTVHVIPNGGITELSNMTKDFSYAVLDVGVGYKERLDDVMAVLNEVGAALRQDAAYGPSILEPLEVLGVESLGAATVDIRVRVKTVPTQQWSVARELRRRIKHAFDERGIELPHPQAPVFTVNRPSPSARPDPR